MGPLLATGTVNGFQDLLSRFFNRGYGAYIAVRNPTWLRERQKTNL